MKMDYLKKVIILVLTSVFICNINPTIIHAKEPIMKEKYTLEEQKIKRAQFIWTACIEELRKDKVLSDEDVNNIRKYLKTYNSNEKSQLPLKRLEQQKESLCVGTVDKMVDDKILTLEQGNKLKKKLNKYDLSNLSE